MGRVGVASENVVFLGRGWWVVVVDGYAVLCCAAAVYTLKPAQSLEEGRKRQSGPPQTLPHTKFMLRLLSPSSSFLQPRPPTQIIVFAARLSS